MNTDMELFKKTPYRFYSFHDFDDNCGYVTIIWNHAWIDGVQIVGVLNYLS